jgi:hypothetical protein
MSAEVRQPDIVFSQRLFYQKPGVDVETNQIYRIIVTIRVYMSISSRSSIFVGHKKDPLSL